MIKILGLFGQTTFKNFTLLHIITRNYTKSHEKKLKDIRYALLRLITANYTLSKFEKIKKKLFFKSFLSRNYALLSAKA
jgi:TRAP-type mannitol/chloroaromatic compound transport system permease small subunit